MANTFSFDTILLVVECEADKICQGKVMLHSCAHWKHSIAIEKLDITQLEGGSMCLFPSTTVFTWPKQKEKGNPCKLTCGLLVETPTCKNVLHIVEDGDGQRVDSLWWWILFFICC